MTAPDFSHKFRLLAQELWTARKVRRSNRAINKAFVYKSSFPSEKTFVFVCAGSMVLLTAITAASLVLSPGNTSTLAVSSPRISPKKIVRVISPSSKPAIQPPEVDVKTEPAKSDLTIEDNDFLEDHVISRSDLADLPKPLMTLTMPESYSQYLVVVDKSRNELFVVEESKDSYTIVRRYPADMGELRGDKEVNGDKKTPEGVYRIVSVKSDDELPERYGPMAFVLNYPNELDKKLGKTGNGIWIHGSGLGEKTDKTKGCVEVNDFNIAKLEKYIDVGTPVYIFPEGFEVPMQNDAIQKNVLKPDTVYSLKENRDRIALGKAVQ